MPYSSRETSLDSAQRMAQSTWTWDDLPWNAPVKLSPEKFDLASHLSSQSSYAEEAGMLIAAKLCRCIEDRDLRRLMAQQAIEEARHSELFERYARVRYGSVVKPTPYIDGLLKLLESFEDPHQLFLIHTIFEGVAMDQFAILGESYRGDLLGDIYRLVRTDEANHVSMGINFLKRSLPNLREDEVKELESWCVSALPDLAGISNVVSLVERTAPHKDGAEIADLLTARFHNRVQQIFSTSSRKEIV